MEYQTIGSQLSIFLTLFIFHHDPQRMLLQPPLYFSCCGIGIKYQGGKAHLCFCARWLTASYHCSWFFSPKGYFPISMYSWTFSDHDYFYLDEAEFLLNILFSDHIENSRGPTAENFLFKSKMSFRQKNNFQSAISLAAFKM